MTDSTKPRILVVDDDVDLLGAVKRHLEKQGYLVRTAGDGRAALAIARAEPLDLVVLDITFPDPEATRGYSIDVIEVLRVLREAGDVPIIMLSSTNIPSVKVMALTIGADDYLSKPFEMQELGARVDAILRRAAQKDTGQRVLNLHRLRLDPGQRRIWKDDTPVELTGIEFEILYTLARRPEHVFSREKIIEIAWKGESYCVPKAVDVHIGHIRKKIEDDPSQPTFIVTVRGIGYRFENVPR